MPAIISGAEYGTFINTFRCQPSNQEEVVRINVDIIEQVASTFPGFISAAVHRKPPSTSPRCSAHPSSRRSAAASPA